MTITVKECTENDFTYAYMISITALRCIYVISFTECIIKCKI